MSVDPIIAAKTATPNRARLRRGSHFRCAGVTGLRGSGGAACPRQIIGYRARAPAYRSMNRDNRLELPEDHGFFTQSPLKTVDRDPRRPCSAPSITPMDARYEQNMWRTAYPPPPPPIRLFVPSSGSKSDPAAGLPGPRAAMLQEGWSGPSTPDNLKKMKGNYRCYIPFRGLARPESAPAGSPDYRMSPTKSLGSPIRRLSVPSRSSLARPGTAAGFNRTTNVA